MVRKIIPVIVLAILFIGCDSDFKQGRCDEGFFEQTDGNGGFLCVPITEEGVIDNTKTDSYQLNETGRTF